MKKESTSNTIKIIYSVAISIAIVFWGIGSAWRFAANRRSADEEIKIKQSKGYIMNVCMSSDKYTWDEMSGSCRTK